MLLCLSFVIMRCTATFAILCLAVLILLEHAQTCFVKVRCRRKKRFHTKITKVFLLKSPVGCPLFALPKKHTAQRIAEHRVVPMLSTTTLCNVASARLLASAMMRCYAVLPWNIGGASSMSMVLCCVQLKSPHLSAMACKKLGGFLECS